MKNHITQAKKHKLLIFFSMPALLVWLALVYSQTSFNYLKISVISQIFEWVIDVINFSLMVYIFKKSRNKIESIGLLTSIVLLFIVDILYFIAYSVPQEKKYTLSFDVAHFMYYAATLTFITFILLKNILNYHKFFIALLILAIIDIGIFVVFSVDTHYIRKNIQAMQLSIDLILFTLAFLWLMHSKILGSALIAAGYILSVSSEFMLTSCYMTNMKHLLVYGEFVWLLGLISIMTGMIFIVTHKQYDIKKWIETGITIRAGFMFNTFSMVFISLIIFFSILKEFSVINEKFYIFSPTIIMDFTLIIAMFSVLSRKMIEQPCTQIQSHIECR